MSSRSPPRWPAWARWSAGLTPGPPRADGGAAARRPRRGLGRAAVGGAARRRPRPTPPGTARPPAARMVRSRQFGPAHSGERGRSRLATAAAHARAAARPATPLIGGARGADVAAALAIIPISGRAERIAQREELLRHQGLDRCGVKRAGWPAASRGNAGPRRPGSYRSRWRCSGWRWPPTRSR